MFRNASFSIHSWRTCLAAWKLEDGGICVAFVVDEGVTVVDEITSWQKTITSAQISNSSILCTFVWSCVHYINIRKKGGGLTFCCSDSHVVVSLASVAVMVARKSQF
mmetsp:Transcript_16234/g.21778  ORF Transcript_16234/g.21778 Transcript_16234/m.21778 type:complete len:107 (-) Transcript_16234:161-481(-)